jgi:hypothetical protein
MDQRETFDSLQKLKTILCGLYQQGERASLLVDSDGLTRMEGRIASVKEMADLGSTVITLEQGEWIYLKQIIAVNGQFRSDYSEC